MMMMLQAEEQLNSPITSLPSEMLTEVLIRVASNSFTDLFNAKISCKDILHATQEDCIYEYVSIQKFPEVPWFTSNKALAFLEQCKERGNAEAMYRQGMMDYFSLKKQESGLEFLKRASSKGHVDAIYAYGLILLCSGDEEKQEGLKILSSLKGSKTMIQLCRERTKRVMNMMWTNNKILKRREQETQKACHCLARRGWELVDNDVITCCNSCLWARESDLFCNMF